MGSSLLPMPALSSNGFIPQCESFGALRVRDVRLDPPCQIRLVGKGNKVRICPIWSRTARLLKNLIHSQQREGEHENDHPFSSMHVEPQ